MKKIWIYNLLLSLILFAVTLFIFNVSFWNTDTDTFRKVGNTSDEIALNPQDSAMQISTEVLIIDSTKNVVHKSEIPPKYSVRQLNLLMDTMNQRITSSDVRYNVPIYYVDETSNRITVNLINYDENHIADFKKHISDSPAIAFVKTGSGRIKGEVCDTCGIEMRALSPIFRLPIDKIEVEIINIGIGV